MRNRLLSLLAVLAALSFLGDNCTALPTVINGDLGEGENCQGGIDCLPGMFCRYQGPNRVGTCLKFPPTCSPTAVCGDKCLGDVEKQCLTYYCVTNFSRVSFTCE